MLSISLPSFPIPPDLRRLNLEVAVRDLKLGTQRLPAISNHENQHLDYRSTSNATPELGLRLSFNW